MWESLNTQVVEDSEIFSFAEVVRVSAGSYVRYNMVAVNVNESSGVYVAIPEGVKQTVAFNSSLPLSGNASLNFSYSTVEILSVNDYINVIHAVCTSELISARKHKLGFKVLRW